jgi:hypothetical protein
MVRLSFFIRSLSVLIFLVIGCSEKLPEGPDTNLNEILLVKLTSDLSGYAQENNYRSQYEIPEGMSWPEFNLRTTWKVYFRVRLENTFDEPIVGTKYIDARIRVWNKNDTTQIRTLTVLDTLSNETIIIQPGETYTVFSGDRFTWDQTDDNGKPFAPKDTFDAYSIQARITYNKYTGVSYRHCDTLAVFPADSVIAFQYPISIVAQATVQLFREYEGMFWKSAALEFPIVFVSHEGWIPVTKPCVEGYVVEGPP